MERQNPWSKALDRIETPVQVLSVIAAFSVIGLFVGVHLSPMSGLAAVTIAAGAWMLLLLVRAAVAMAFSSSSGPSFGERLTEVAKHDADTAFNYVFLIGWIALCVKAPLIGIAVLAVIGALGVAYLVVGVRNNSQPQPPADDDAPEA